LAIREMTAFGEVRPEANPCDQRRPRREFPVAQVTSLRRQERKMSGTPLETRSRELQLAPFVRVPVAKLPEPRHSPAQRVRR
jgi:hypothetical protein